MSVVPLHVATQTRLCKSDGCENEALAVRGRYAGLCGDCVVRRRRESAEQLRQRVHAAGDGEQRRYEQRVRELIPVARQLDRALERYRPVRAELQTAMRAWAEALEALGS